MRQLMYALRFTGRATPSGPDGSVLAIAAAAPGAALVAAISPAGLAARLEPDAGAEATFAAELTLTGATSFQAIGAIVFGAGHRLHVATVGGGYLDRGADPALRHGAALWRVEGGEGRFAGASGLITSNVIIGDDLAITDHHLGVLFLP